MVYCRKDEHDNRVLWKLIIWVFVGGEKNVLLAAVGVVSLL